MMGDLQYVTAEPFAVSGKKNFRLSADIPRKKNGVNEQDETS